MKTVADSSSNLAINEKLHEWEKLENCSAPLSTFQRNICLDLGDEVTARPFSKYVSFTLATVVRYSEYISHLFCFSCYQKVLIPPTNLLIQKI